MWCCLEMVGPESQSSSAGAAIKGFDRVDEFPLCISVFQMEDAYLGFLWISPEVVGSVVWSQACECITKSLSTSSKDCFCVAMHISSAYRKLLVLE